MVKLAINGFGRIGRISLRVWLGRPDLQADSKIIAINTSGSMDLAGWAHLLKYDTAYGPLKTPFSLEPANQPPLLGYLVFGASKIPVLAQPDPSLIPWSTHQAEVIIESTGVFRDKDSAAKHLTAGAKRVVISAPSKGEGVNTFVIGANQYDGQAEIIDNASCTTNCIAPVVAILQAKFGVLKAAMTTVHGYTDDQKLQDGSHKDLRRARAAAQNLVPTTTGAAKSTTKTIPALSGLFDGVALRAPVVTGSISDITALVKTPTTVEAVNQAFVDASNDPTLKGIVATTTEPLVSSDIVGRSESAIVDLSLTQVIAADMVKVFAWYDNEWGYANRLLEQALTVGKSL